MPGPPVHMRRRYSCLGNAARGCVSACATVTGLHVYSSHASPRPFPFCGNAHLIMRHHDIYMDSILLQTTLFPLLGAFCVACSVSFLVLLFIDFVERLLQTAWTL